MLKNRVIPVLLIDNGALVKTKRFSDARYVGDPINTVRIFNEKEVDELLILDISATRLRQEPNYRLMERIAGECFMPIGYGGGVKNVEQARRLFSLGVEKLCLQSAALADLSIVRELSAHFGNQSILVSLDVKKNLFGNYRLYAASKRESIKMDWRAFLVSAVRAGAGEVVLCSVDCEGMMTGMDRILIDQAASLVDVPLISVGGVGSLAHIKEGIDAGASAVGVGSFCVYRGPHRAVLITYPRYGELEAVLG